MCNSDSRIVDHKPQASAFYLPGWFSSVMGGLTRLQPSWEAGGVRFWTVQPPISSSGPALPSPCCRGGGPLQSLWPWYWRMNMGTLHGTSAFLVHFLTVKWKALLWGPQSRWENNLPEEVAAKPPLQLHHWEASSLLNLHTGPRHWSCQDFFSNSLEIVSGKAGQSTLIPALIPWEGGAENTGREEASR